MKISKQIYKLLISSWRKAFNTLSIEEQKRIQLINDLRSPCQINVIVIENKELAITSQKWVISHFTNEPDKNIEILGPIDTKDVLNKIGEFTSNERWDKPLPKDNRFFATKTYKDIIEGHMLALVDSHRRSVFGKIWEDQNIKSGMQSRQLISKEMAIWSYNGTLTKDDIDNIVEKEITNIKKGVPKATQPKLNQANHTRIAELQAYGTYIYPNVFIGVKPKLSFGEKLKRSMYGRGPNYPRKNDIILYKKSNKLTWIATQKGIIGVISDNPNTALRLLNVFMSLLTLQGFPAFAIRENELISMTLNAENGFIMRSNVPIILPRMLHEDISSDIPEWQLQSMKVVSKTTVNKIFRDINKIYKDDFILDELSMFGDIYTHYQKLEYSQAVIYSWILIEKWVSHKYEEIFTTLDKKGNKGKALVRETSQLLETEQIFSSNITEKLHGLRNLRNQLMHSSKQITKDEAKIALETVAELLGSGI